MTYLWNHYPELSSAPTRLEFHFLKEDKDEIFECAIFLLENSRYALVRISSDDKKDLNVGVTEVEEFDSIKDAAILFEELTMELIDE